MQSKTVLLNTFAQILGKVGSVVASFLVIKIVSSFGKDFYGAYLTSYEFLAFFGILADAGLFAIAVREMSREKQENAQVHIFSNVFSLRLLLVIAAILLAGSIASLIPYYPPEVKKGIWITGISMALTIIAGTLSAILQARMKIYYFSLALVLGKIALAGMIFFLAATSFPDETQRFYAFLWAGVAANSLFLLLVWRAARRYLPIRIGVDIAYWKKLFSSSLPYGVALILQTLYLRADILLISLLLGLKAVGTYGVAARILESFLVLGVFFGQALLPKMSQEEHDKKKRKETLQWGMEKIIFITFPMILGVSYFAPEIIRLLSNESYLTTPKEVGADFILFLLIPVIFFAYFNQLFSFALLSKSQQSFLLLTHSIALGANILLNLLLLPQYGIIAAAITTIFCEMLVFFLLLYKLQDDLSWRCSLQKWGLLLSPFFLLWLGISLPPFSHNLFLSVLLGILIYGVWIYRFRRALL